MKIIVAGGEGFIGSALVQMIINEKDKNYTDQISFVTDISGHGFRCAIDAFKIECELGWTPEETFESGMKKNHQMVPR